LSKYRNRVEIVADILNIVENGARKTQIMYKGNLSYKLLTRYLGEVIGAGLVCAGERTGLYQLTEKGKMFLKHFENYSKSRNEAEQNLTTMKTLKTKLENMCAIKAASNVRSGSEGEERNPS
jgi:predicted transcriptional regulator